MKKQAANYYLQEIALSYIVNTTNRKPKLWTVKDAEDYLRAIWNKDHLSLMESAYVVLLNKAKSVIGWFKLAQGGMTQVIIDQKLILGAGLKSAACYVLMGHNLTSGHAVPSELDMDLSRELFKACQMVGLRLLDWVVLTPEGYFSFHKEGLLSGSVNSTSYASVV